jgi:hypothetical protein
MGFDDEEEAIGGGLSNKTGCPIDLFFLEVSGPDLGGSFSLSYFLRPVIRWEVGL